MTEYCLAKYESSLYKTAKTGFVCRRTCVMPAYGFRCSCGARN